MVGFSWLSKLLRGGGALKAADAGGDVLKLTVKNPGISAKLFAGSVAGTAVGTYFVTLYTKAGDFNGMVADVLGIPEWASSILLALFGGIVLLYVLSKISKMRASHRADRSDVRYMRDIARDTNAYRSERCGCGDYRRRQ